MCGCSIDYNQLRERKRAIKLIDNCCYLKCSHRSSCAAYVSTGAKPLIFFSSVSQDVATCSKTEVICVVENDLNWWRKQWRQRKERTNYSEQARHRQLSNSNLWKAPFWSIICSPTIRIPMPVTRRRHRHRHPNSIVHCNICFTPPILTLFAN